MSVRNRRLASTFGLALLLAGHRGGSNPSAMQPGSGLTPAGKSRFSALQHIAAPATGWKRDERILPGLTRRYVLPLSAGQFVHVAVKQNEIDVTTRIRWATELLEVDSPTGTRGTEDLFFLATATGRHRLDVEAGKAEGPPALGAYEIRIVTLRSATSEDAARARAADRFSRARKLENSPSSGEAAALYAEAARLWAGLGEPGREAQAREELAELFEGIPTRQAERSILLNRALELYRQTGVARRQAVILSHLGQLEEKRRHFEAATRRFEEALALFDPARDAQQIASRQNDLAIIRVRQGRLDEAIELYDRAIKTLERLGNPSDIATARSNLGVLFLHLDDGRRAQEQFQRSLRLFQETGEKLEQAKALTRLGEAVLWLDAPAKALPYLEKALALREELGDERGRAVTLVGIGLTYSYINRPREALQALHRAVAIFQKARDSAGDQAVAYHSLGDIYERLEDLGRARDYYERALHLARVGSLPRTVAALELALARLDKRQGRLADALRRLENLSGSGNGWRERAFNQERNELLVDLLADLHHLHPQAGYESRAFAASESSRAQSFLALHARSHEKPDPRELARLDELSRQIRFHSLARASASWTGTVKTPGESGANELQSLLDDLWLSRKPGAPPPPLSIEEVQTRILDDETLLLEYHLGETRSLLWAISRHDRRLVVLPDRGEIEKAAQAMLRFLNDGYRALDEHRYQKAVEHLSRMLLAPIADLLEKQRLVVVAPGILQGVPFNALHLPLDTGPDADLSDLLISDHEVVSEPSITLLPTLRAQEENRRPASALLAVVADPVFEADDERLVRSLGGRAAPPTMRSPTATSLQRLAYAGNEADSVLGLAGTSPKSAAKGLDATRDLVLSGRLRDYQILHFATHSRYDDRFPELSSLALSNFDRSGRWIDGNLRAYEIFDLDLRADLVVLSACRTAWDEGDGAEGRAGLTQGFLHAGASSVVVSLWNVDDRATSTLMKYFYDALLRQKLPAAKALRQAQLEIRKEKGWQSPYYWAGFVLQGDWE